MNKFQKGLAEAIIGIVMGILLITIIDAFAKDGLIPKYFVWLFGLFSIIANIATINSFRYAGLLYSIGWLLGSLLLRDLLGPADIVFNIVSPIIILVLRVWFWIKDIRRLGQYLPIDFKTIEYALRYERAARIYHDELIEQKRKDGVIKETWEGSIVSFGYTLSEEDNKWIQNKAEGAARNNIYVESGTVYIDFDEAEKTLSDTLFHLRQQGIKAITEPIIPDVDTDHAKWVWAHYSYDTLIKYVARHYTIRYGTCQALCKVSHCYEV